MGTRPEDIAARASQLEADADGIRTQNERKLEMDDTKKRIDEVKERLVEHEVTAAQNRGLARKLRENAEDIKASVRGDVGYGEEQPTGEAARAAWRRAREAEEKADALEKTAEDEEEAAAAARTELEQYEERLETLQEEYKDAELMAPEDYDAAPLPQGDFGPGTGSDVAALVASEAGALGDGEDMAGDDALAAQVDMAAVAASGDGALDPTLDAENPEHPGFGPTPEDPTIDVETPEMPDVVSPPDDPTIDVETPDIEAPEVPDLELPDSGPAPEPADMGDGGFDSA